MILILFGCGRYCLREYRKNTRKLKLCIIMHNYAKYAFFESWIKTTFLCISDDFQHFLFFHLKYFSETSKISLCVAARKLGTYQRYPVTKMHVISHVTVMVYHVIMTQYHVMYHVVCLSISKH